MPPGRRALVLTDNLPALSLFGDALCDANVCDVAIVRTQAEAIERCVYGGFSCALVDVAVTGPDGGVFLRSIRSAGHPSARMPVLLVDRAAGRMRVVADFRSAVVNLAHPAPGAMISAHVKAVFADITER